MKKSFKIISITLALIMAFSTLVIGASVTTVSAAQNGKVNLNSIAYNTDASVSLGWTTNINRNYFTGFQIAKKKLGDKSYTYSDVVSFDSYYKDKKAVCGTIYYYQIRTYSMSMNGTTYSPWSNVKSITTLYRPTVTNINDMNTMLNINWNKIKGVSHYRLAFRRTTDKAWNYRNVKSTYYNVPNPTKGATYVIQVCPMNGNIAGQWSAAKTKVVGQSLYKPVITAVEYYDDKDFQFEKMDWTYQLPCKGYYVYYKSADDPDWSYEIVNDVEGIYNSVYMAFEHGKTYYFQIRAFDPYGNFSPFSKVYSYTIPMHYEA